MTDKWIRRGTNGWVHKPPPYAISIYAPALTSYRGELWTMWADEGNAAWYASGTNESFGSKVRFPEDQSEAPALCTLNGVLHAVIVNKDMGLVHYQYLDTTVASPKWAKRSGLGATTTKGPAILGYQGKIFCAYTTAGNTLEYAIWDPENGWSLQGSTGNTTWGCPAMFEVKGQLILMFAGNSDRRIIYGLRYDPKFKNDWPRWDNPPESSAYGVSGVSFNNRAFMGFQQNGSGNNRYAVYVSEYNNGWIDHKDVDAQLAANNPAIAILNGYVSCIFNARNENPHKDLLWFSRPMTSYPLEAWMKAIADDRALSSMSIPGTHDTCAISVFNFVGDQLLTIPQQLAAGIRYFDLRVALYEGVPTMYHGIYRINLPSSKTLESVLKDMVAFLNQNPSEGIIAQIKAEGSDDTTEFYNKVKAVLDNQKTSSWNYMNLGTVTPTMKGVRKKIQLMRRFSMPADTSDIGIDVTNWADNATFSIKTATGVNLTIQDQYLWGEPAKSLKWVVESKWKAVEAALTAASATSSSKDTWYINFSSATSEWGNIWVPAQIAVGDPSIFTSGVNDSLRSYQYNIKTRYGVILMDFPEIPFGDIPARIIESNF